MKIYKRTENARKQISDIYLDVAKMSGFLSELQIQAESLLIKSQVFFEENFKKSI
ncbi:MAG: hypothetical protein BACD_01977 [Bacteroides rodentium]